MSDILQRIGSVLSENTFSVGASAVQISGGPASNWPLTAVSASFYPNYHRAGILVVNTGNTTVYIGVNSSVSPTGHWIAQLLPGNAWPPSGQQNYNGSATLYAYSSAAGGQLTMIETD